MTADGVVLPGVGRLRRLRPGAARLGARRGGAALHREARPFLGICVGLQLLFEGSEEDPGVPGLGILAGRVRAHAARASAARRCSGTSCAQPPGTSSRLLGESASQWYYFVHSYTPVPEGAGALESVVGTCDYGGELAVAFEGGNMFGTQFHPEKSASAGLGLLGRFARICAETALEAMNLELWPAIDIRGRQVRAACARASSPRRPSTATRSSRRRPSSPAGARRLHVVDLDAARDGRCAEPGDRARQSPLRTGVPVQAGGRIRDEAAAAALLGGGVARVVVGTLAVEQPELLARMVARWPGRVLVGLDHRPAVGPDGAITREVAVRGWVNGGGPELGATLAQVDGPGLGGVVVTDIDRDGTGAGPDLTGMERVLALTTAAGRRLGRGRDGRRPRCLSGPWRRRATPERRHRRPGALVGAALDERGGGRMRAVRVIPCLDVDRGRVVKGVEFKGLRDAGDPVALAARYDAEGADELVFLDITASSDDRATMVQVVERAAEEVFIPLTVGGGVRSVADGRALLRAGADKVGGELGRGRNARGDRGARRRVRRPVRGRGHRCPPQARERGLGGLHPRRTACHRSRRRELGGRVHPPRSRGAPCHLDGSRRHRGRLRPRADEADRRTRCACL